MHLGEKYNFKIAETGFGNFGSTKPTMIYIILILNYMHTHSWILRRDHYKI